MQPRQDVPEPRIVEDAQWIIEDLHDQVRELKTKPGTEQEITALMELVQEVAHGTTHLQR